MTNVFGSNQGSEDLFPMSGHQGTSLGAVDANGNIAEQTSADAFGNLNQATNLKQSHIYTGEYFDADSQLTYLRARWYDAKMGRFISADPFEGRQQDPRSLNRYSYAHNDPVHISDPTGGFSMGEVGAGMSAMANLATTAINVIDIASLLFGGDDNSERSGIWDAVMQMGVSAIGGMIGATSQGNISTGTSLAAPIEGHHTIPIYLCGARKQNLVRIERSTHKRIHRDLLTTYAIVQGLGFAADKIFFKTRIINRPAIVRVARTKGGRGAIATALLAYYAENDLLSVGEFNAKNPPLLQELGPIFASEAKKFVDKRADTSWPLCVR